MVTMAKAPPCMADARKAAEAITTGEVSTVLLFGSVARGDPGPHSDIDLVAIYDDLDYETRSDRSDELGRRATEAAGHSVFVYVTDWPEWEERTACVRSSLESAIAGNAVMLYQRKPGRVRWGKEIGLPSTDAEEATVRLDNAGNALFGMFDQLKMGSAEEAALDARDPSSYEYAMRRRMSDVCAKAQMAMESSLKALIHLDGARPARTHNLDELIVVLAQPHRKRIRRMFHEITPAEASQWRVVSSYQYAKYSLARIVPHAYHMARVGIEMSRYAADHLPDSEPADRILTVAGWAESTLDGWHPEAEAPYAVTGQPFPTEI